MGDFLDKAKDFAGQHDEQVDGAVDKAGDQVDQKTGGKYEQHVDTAQDKAGDFLGGDDK